MRNHPIVKAERHRIRHGEMGSDTSYGRNGAFRIAQKNGPDLVVVASDGGGWEHVSVSTAARCPTYEEMELVRDLFWREDEWVVQFSPAKSAKVNNHPYCLHWWRPSDGTFPVPAEWMVGYKAWNLPEPRPERTDP